MRVSGQLLVTAQVGLCLALIWLGGKGVWERPWLWTGVALGAWVVWSGVRAMRWSRLKITPEPGGDASLCDRGIYGVIRHPMYAGVLLAFAMFAAGTPGWSGWIAWAGLFVVLWTKWTVEERLWTRREPAYRDYRRRTKRIVPWVW